MPDSLSTSPAADVLDALYADAAEKGKAFQADAFREAQTPLERFTVAKDQYLPIGRPFGRLLYALVRAARPGLVVEFGTSFGISTIYLAAALRDNNHGQLITTEFIESKADTARQNLEQAGLADLVDFRVGDALQTLAEPLPGPVDLLFLDGEKSLYLPVLQRLEPHLRPGSLVASDNTDQPNTQPFLDHLQDPAQGYASAPILTPTGAQTTGHEIAVRL